MFCFAKSRVVLVIVVSSLISLQSFAASLFKLDQGSIVKINEGTGVVEKEYPPTNYPYISFTIHQNFAYAGIERGIIYKIALDSGEIAGSMIAPLAGFSQLATDGSLLWIATGGSIFQLRLSDGVKLSQFSAPDTHCRGLVWEEGMLRYTAEEGTVHSLPIRSVEQPTEVEVAPAPASFSPAPGRPTP